MVLYKCIYYFWRHLKTFSFNNCHQTVWPICHHRTDIWCSINASIIIIIIITSIIIKILTCLIMWHQRKCQWQDSQCKRVAPITLHFRPRRIPTPRPLTLQFTTLHITPRSLSTPITYHIGTRHWWCVVHKLSDHNWINRTFYITIQCCRECPRPKSQ